MKLIAAVLFVIFASQFLSEYYLFRLVRFVSEQ